MRLPSPALPLAVLLVGSPVFGQAKAGPEFRVNEATTGFQYGAKAAAAAAGGFVVTWVDQYGGYGDVRAQRYDARGTPLGGNFQVNSHTGEAGGRYYLKIAADRNGNFVVAWGGLYPDSYGLDVLGRRFDREARPLGAEFLVNTYTSGAEGASDLAMAPGGKFVVSWGELRPDFNFDVAARRFAAGGAARGDEFVLSAATTGSQFLPSVGIADDGSFVATYVGYNAQGERGLFGLRFDDQARPQGAEFRVTGSPTDLVGQPLVRVAPDHTFIVSWTGAFTPPADVPVFVRRFDASGSPFGPQFRVNAPGVSFYPATAFDGSGRFVVAWAGSPDGYSYDIHARRFDAQGVPLGAEFLVNTSTTGTQYLPAVASDAVGNFVVVWSSAVTDDGADAYAQRFGGLLPVANEVVDGANGVLEVPDFFFLRTQWRNVSGAAQAFQGAASAVQLPPGLGLTLSPQADYRTVPDGGYGTCSGSCFGGRLLGVRPPGHQDIRFNETIVPAVQGQLQQWRVHIGDSFVDVPRTGSYRFVETLLHRGVTAGCGGDRFCPAASTAREQMAVFLLLSAEGAGYAPAPCGAPVFADVPSSSPFCPFVEELARRGVTTGCGGGNFCPQAAVSREQMAVFLLRTLDPALSPPACGAPVFGNVPASSPYCRWIEELVRRGITAGCGGGNYCPQPAVTREQMAAFLTETFGLRLYGP